MIRAGLVCSVVRVWLAKIVTVGYIASNFALFVKLFMELHRNFTDVFAALYHSLSEKDVQAIDYLLRINHDLRWPALEPLTARAVLIKMMELGIWYINHQLRECNLSRLIYLLEKIGRVDLSVAVKNLGK